MNSGPRTFNLKHWNLDRRVDRRGALAAELAELVRGRAEGLDPSDRAVLEAVLIAGQSVAEVSKIAGVPTRRMHRRVARLLARLATPAYGYVLARRAGWPPKRRRVAEACVLRGLSQRAAAAELGLTLYVVRYHTQRIAAQVESLGEVGRDRGVA